MSDIDANLFVHRNAATKFLNDAATWALSPLEAYLTARARPEDCEACFVFGPPRSGTTLLFELLTTEFEAAYLSNVAQRLYRCPVAATRLYRSALRKRTGAFDSKYGQLTGPAAPSENGRIWRYWMPDAAPYFAEGDGLGVDQMQRKIAAFCGILGGPMIVKYLHFSSEIPRLDTCFPKSVYVHIERDRVENVRSIIRARQKLNPGMSRKWFSSRPKGWKAYVDCDPVVQACAQVVLCHAEIRNALCDSGRYLHIRYEDLCTDRDGSLERIEALFDRNAIRYKRRFRSSSAFEMRAQDPFDHETEEKIHTALKRIEAEISVK